METMTMNVQLVSPAAFVAVLASPSDGSESGRAGMLWRELRRLDDRDLDDLNLGRGDLPGLARRHAREAPGLTRVGGEWCPGTEI
jgi:hypothetical protein